MMGSVDERTKAWIRAWLDDKSHGMAPLMIPEPEPMVAEYGVSEKVLTAPAIRKRVLLIREMGAPMPWTGEWELAYRWRVAVDEGTPDVPLVHGTPEPVRTGRPWWDPALHTFV